MSNSIIQPEKSKFLRYLKAYLPFWQKKKIGFWGYFGQGDLGDDAAFLAGKDILAEDIFPISKRCFAFNPHSLRGLLIGGGAILKSKYPFIPRRLLMKAKWNFPVILFSAGVGCDYNEVFTNQAKDKIKRLCDLADYITVRDKISQEFLSNLGYQDAAILPHLELALQDSPQQLNFNKSGFTVGIVLTPHPEFDNRVFEKMVDVFSRFTDYLTDNHNRVIYLPFEKADSENTRESVVITEIIKRLNNKDRAEALRGNLQPQEMLYFIKNYCDMLVCMRLHSAVFSTNAGIPFFCISYNLMHQGFLGMLQAQDLGISIFEDFSLQTLIDKFEYVQGHYSQIKSKLTAKRDNLRNTIYSQAAHVKGILLKRAI
ncbi:MAG: polysaccharide pyruvyl transferase family protein [Candidatus Omnitrophota bacterium]|jgi:polysaccharide pyruvyl transferase WcaK-like protein